MARINIEDKFWVDVGAVAAKMGDLDRAVGQALRLIRHAQEKHRDGEQITVADFRTRFSDALIPEFAQIDGEHVKVAGASKHFGWLEQKREAGRAGGKVSAKRPRDSKGRLIKTKQEPSKSNQDIQADSPSETKQIQPYGSGSGSVSGSRDSVPTERAPTGANDAIGFFYSTWERVHSAKPPRKGSNHGILARVVRENGIERTLYLLEAYFAMPDSWVKKTAHDLTVFASKLNEVAKFADSGQFVTMTAVRKADEDVHHRQENLKALDNLPDDTRQEYLDCFEDKKPKALIGGGK
jgi:hypothetical protein